MFLPRDVPTLFIHTYAHPYNTHTLPLSNYPLPSPLISNCQESSTKLLRSITRTLTTKQIDFAKLATLAGYKNQR